LSDPSLDRSWRNPLAEAIAAGNAQQVDQATGELLRALNQIRQERLVTQLAAHPQSAQRLMEWMETGQISPRLLQRPAIRERLLAGKEVDRRERIDQWLAKLPAEAAETGQLLRSIGQEYQASGNSRSAERGRAVFVQHCQACHQVAGQGTVVGPQLDGIGQRGLERLVEDLFAPYRNIDVAFQTTIVTMDDGRVITGLARDRNESTWTLVNSEGKPTTIEAARIESHEASTTSIMPDNFGTILTQGARVDLLAYLMDLSTRGGANPAR
jgi:putative heme-binding domain-containing protein